MYLTVIVRESRGDVKWVGKAIFTRALEMARPHLSGIGLTSPEMGRTQEEQFSPLGNMTACRTPHTAVAGRKWSMSSRVPVRSSAHTASTAIPVLTEPAGLTPATR